MTEQEWRRVFGQVVRDGVLTPEFERFFSTRFTKARARLSLVQLGLFIRHRRDCWAFLSGNCPEMSVKQKILRHEYEEIIKDQYTEHGHLELIVQQGKALGMTAEEALNGTPIPTTWATLYGWGWLCRERHWLEALGALMATEWGNDDRLFADVGGGISRREGVRWVEDLGLAWEDIPNLAVHAEADEEHAEMFVSAVAEFARGPEMEARVLAAARESLDLYRVFRGGLADAMAVLP